MESDFKSLVKVYHKFVEISRKKELKNRIVLKKTKRKTLVIYISGLDRLDFELVEHCGKDDSSFDLARIPMVEDIKNDPIDRHVPTKDVYFFHRLRKENQQNIMTIIEEQIINHL